MKLDRATRHTALAPARRAARQLFGDRQLRVEVDGLVVHGTVQNRAYLDSLKRGSAEPHTLALFREAVQPNDVVADVGAFLGVYALTAAAVGARVYAFEPNERSRRLLAANVTANRADVRIEPYALSDTEGEVTFYVGDGDRSSSGLAPAASNVTPVTVEARMMKNLLERVDVVKIDTEGAEIACLSGMGELIKTARALFVECNPLGLAKFGATPSDLVRLLMSHGLTVRSIHEDGGLSGPESAIALQRGYLNLLATR